MHLYSIAVVAVSLVLGTASAHAADLDEGDIVFTYNAGGSTYNAGTAKKENYDVAIKLSDAALVGTTLKQIIVPLSSTTVTNLKVWISSELNLETVDGVKTIVPDIYTTDVDVTGTTIDVVLDEPYSITDEAVYVGYSFQIETLDSENSYPVVVGTETTADGLYLHSTRTYRSWNELSDSWGVSALQLVVSGVGENSAGVTLPSELNVQYDQDKTFSVTVVNHGYAGISSYEYEYTVNDVTVTGTVELGDDAVPAQYNATTTLDVSLTALGVTGYYPLTFTVTKVNGVENSDVLASGSFTVNSYELLPVHKVVFEEYTGTWCGYCPRGYVALEIMKSLYPDDFIGISYHNGDDMEIMYSKYFPSTIVGYPSAFYDRKYEADPYYGIDGSSFIIPEEWLELCETEIAPATIEVTGVLSDDEGSVTAEATVAFIDSYDDADYSLEFVLLADSLYDEDWYQTNYYYNNTYGTFPEEEFEKFTSGDYYVYGLYFSDVIVFTTNVSSSNIALPAQITANESLTESYTIDLSQVKNTDGNDIIQDVNQLTAVVLIIDNTTGYIVNADKAKVQTATGISVVETEPTTDHRVEYYDISGRRISAPVRGVNIVRAADGRTIKYVQK